MDTPETKTSTRKMDSAILDYLEKHPARLAELGTLELGAKPLRGVLLEWMAADQGPSSPPIDPDPPAA